VASKQRVVCLVQARMGSSRLPGKSLMALDRRPLIAHVLQRARAIAGVDLVALATSVTARDAGLASEADRLGFEVFCGSEWDVLHRMARAAEVYRADIVVRVTGDCPFLDPYVGAEVLHVHRHQPIRTDYTSNDTSCSGFPDGTDVEVISRGALEAAAERSTARQDREHVTPWIRRTLTTAMLQSPVDLRRFKLSVDTPADYCRAQAIVAHLPPDDFRMQSTIDALLRSERG
jgi:spore coat polysaccharide biosynthesis protein SpsF (cytidylyltransferase family)